MKFAADENFNNRIIRGLLRRKPELDITRIQDTEFKSTEDSIILAWAAEEGRILLTHDGRTVPQFAYERIGSGEKIAGVIVASEKHPIRSVIEELLIIEACSSAHEWVNQVRRLPL